MAAEKPYSQSTPCTDQPPSSDAEPSTDAYHIEWHTPDRHFVLTPGNFTKRNSYPHEQTPNYKGDLTIPWSRQRLENERSALEFIAKTTSIPVPTLIDFQQDGDVRILTTNAISDQPTRMDCLYDELDTLGRQALVERVTAQMETRILPELQSIKSNKTGNLNGILIPPPRISANHQRPLWRRKVSSADEFVFCHCDLSQHNIIVHPDTYDVVMIIDWEYAGFFPPEFELPLWKMSLGEYWEEFNAHMESREREFDRLIAMLDVGDVTIFDRSRSALALIRDVVGLAFSWFKMKSFSAFSRIYNVFRRG